VSHEKANAQANTVRGPEFRLLLDCLRPERTPPADLMPPDLDWDLLLHLAARHSVLPLVHRALGQHPGVPGPIREALESRFRQSACRSLFLSAELMRLLDGFADRGIPLLPYKGPTLAQQLYGDVALRSFSDLDLLVASGDVQRATDALESLGYAADHPVPRRRRAAHRALASEQMFRRTTGSTLVELQWRIAPAYFSVDFNWDWLRSTAVRVPLGERQVPALAPEALLMALSVHGAKHCWESLVWIADIAQLLRSHSGLDWDFLLKTARSLGIQRLLFLALSLGEKISGVSPPDAVARMVAADPTLPWLCRQVEHHLAADVRGVPSLADHWFSLRGRERWRDRLRYATRLGLTPNPQDWALLPLPSALSPLYFLVRPLRLLGRTARFAWRRVSGAVAPAASPAERPAER